MKQHDQLTLSLPADYAFERIARRSVAAYARCVGFSGCRIADITSALGEAFLTVLDRIVPESGTPIFIDCSFDGDQLAVDVCYGEPATVLTYQPAPPVTTLPASPTYRELGWLLMQQLADDLRLAVIAPDRRNLRLIWNRPRTPVVAGVAQPV